VSDYDLLSATMQFMNPTSGRHPFWIPNTNVFISDSDNLIVQLELSGLQRDDLEITNEGRTLRIVGNRRNSEFTAAKTVLVQEMHTGPFESVLELPPGFDVTAASSAYLDGVLRIIIPKEGSSQPPQFPLRN